MAEMGKYCKAYQVLRLREFSGWKEDATRRATDSPRGNTVSDDSVRPLEDNDVVYLHEDLIVTDGVYRDESVIFDQVTEAWREFCEKTLEFRIPDYVDPGSGK